MRCLPVGSPSAIVGYLVIEDKSERGAELNKPRKQEIWISLAKALPLQLEVT